MSALPCDHHRPGSHERAALLPSPVQAGDPGTDPGSGSGSCLSDRPATCSAAP